VLQRLADLREAIARPLEPVTAATGRVFAHRIGGPAVKGALFVLATYLAAKQFFDPPNGLLLYAACLGTLYGLIGVGVILIYRTNRIVNFAAGGLGAAPSVFVLTIFTQKAWLDPEDSVFGYLAYFIVATALGAILGGLVDVVIIRRFAQAPRLILTVVTIGVAQILAYVSFFIPDWLGAERLPERLSTPFSAPKREVIIQGRPDIIISYDYFLAAIVVALCSIALGVFFKFTRMGIAIRASAENADRAALLGIPVRRVGTVAWALAGAFAAITVFMRSPLVGLPLGGLTSAGVILFALTAAVIARMERIPVCIAAGTALGVLDQSAVFAYGNPNVVTAITLVLVLGAMLLQRGTLARAYDTGVSTWQAVKEFRSTPVELVGLREVRTARAVLGGLVAVFLLAAPYLVGESRRSYATLILLWAMVGVSLVILTGWAGQISLGQFGLVGVGALTAGHLSANHNFDFFAVVLIGGLVGAGVAILIGIPALRIQGLFLAVTTLAFAAFTQFYVLDPDFPIAERFMPKSATRIERPMLWQRFDVSGELAFYYVCLGFLALTLLAAASFRRHRSGRVLIAIRDNSRAASSYSINLARNRLAAFAVSGFIASVAGVLYGYQLNAVDSGTYGTANSLNAFAITVVGGMTSLMGAVLGAVVIQGIRYLEDIFDAPQLQLLVTGPGLVLVLLMLPGGFAEGVYRIRDSLLRRVANKHGIHVPSLVADKRIEPDEAEQDIVTRAEEHVEEVDARGVLSGPTIMCPVCNLELELESAPEHEHLKPVSVVDMEPTS
jgi:branched-chain amino acid transport system permease protein